MDSNQVIEWSRESLRVALLLGGPPLLAALLVAVVIGLFQAVIQLNDPVVAQVPRLAAMVLIVMVALPWLVSFWVAYARTLIGGLA